MLVEHLLALGRSQGFFQYAVERQGHKLIYLPKSLRTHAVYFSLVIDQIPAELLHLEAYQWLRAFKEWEYKPVNEVRRHVVYYGSSVVNNYLITSNLLIIEQKRQQKLDYLKMLLFSFAT